MRWISLLWLAKQGWAWLFHWQDTTWICHMMEGFVTKWGTQMIPNAVALVRKAIHSKTEAKTHLWIVRLFAVVIPKGKSQNEKQTRLFQNLINNSYLKNIINAAQTINSRVKQCCTKNNFLFNPFNTLERLFYFNLFYFVCWTVPLIEN